MTSTTTLVALVTGGSGGIGRATALRLAADGMAVGVHYAGNEARAKEVVEAITTGGGRANAVGGDVADETEMAAAFDAVEAEFGRRSRSWPGPPGGSTARPCSATAGWREPPDRHQHHHTRRSTEP